MSETVSIDAVLSEKIRGRAAHISVIGQGYVGLPLAVEFARAGFTVSGIDSDLDRVGGLNAGRPSTPDVADEDLARLLAAGRYEATTDLDVVRRSDVVIICVPTPLRKSKDPDISFVMQAGEAAARRFRPGQLIVLESTTYPGTTEELLLPLLAEQGARVGADCFLAFSPERIDPGNASFPVRRIPKLVGGVTARCTALAALLYRQIVERVLEVSSPKVAELAKLYENVFRNVNIALANEFAVMCRRLDVSAREVIDAAATKPFGFMPFYPGPGIGGHCIAVDPFYLSWKMRLNGYEARFIHLADEVNAAMPGYVVDLVADALNRRRRCLNGARVLVLGVAYKRGVADTRESPALDIVARLHDKGAEVAYADPYVPAITVDGHAVKAIELTDEALAASDCVVIATDHPGIDYAHVVALAPLVIDTRSATHGIVAPPGRLETL